jgi:hypothetical protein
MTKIPAEMEEIIQKELDKIFESAVVPTQEYGPIEQHVSTTPYVPKAKKDKSKSPLDNPNLSPQDRKQLRSTLQWLLEGLAQAHKVGDDKRARKTRNQLRRHGWYVNTHGKELPLEFVPMKHLTPEELAKMEELTEKLTKGDL